MEYLAGFLLGRSLVGGTTDAMIGSQYKISKERFIQIRKSIRERGKNIILYKKLLDNTPETFPFPRTPVINLLVEKAQVRDNSLAVRYLQDIGIDCVKEKGKKRTNREILRKICETFHISKQGKPQILQERILTYPIIFKKEEKKKTRRQNCENNAYELLLAIIFASFIQENKLNIENITTDSVQQFLETDKIIDRQYLDINAYIKDLTKKLESKKTQTYLQKWVQNLSYELSSSTTPLGVTLDQIERIYITGKKIKINEINELNKNILNKKKDAKSDIYFKLKNESYIGVSVKQGTTCTKTNYSLMGYFTEQCDSKECKRKKLEILDGTEKEPKKGTPNYETEHLRIRDTHRKKLELYNKYGVFWTMMRPYIQKYKIPMTESIIKSLLSMNVQYPVYEFDGKNLTHLNIYRGYNIENIQLLEKDDEYYSKHNAAKMFYTLSFTINEIEKTFNMEIRFKNPHHTSNPQWLTGSGRYDYV